MSLEKSFCAIYLIKRLVNNMLIIFSMMITCFFVETVSIEMDSEPLVKQNTDI